ncbi:YfbM family protein [Myceligenerans salitolerans]|nr:YfbM family protein [Myceligenerans salitolerans]
MIGEYFRLDPQDLDKALADPGWAERLIEELYDAEDRGETRDSRLFDIDKAWHGIAFALERADVDTAVIYGDAQVPGAGDWGYGPPSSLTPGRVRELAGKLNELDPKTIVRAVPRKEFTASDIYPATGWDDEDLDYLAHWLEKLITFYGQAADAEMGMLVWLD